MSAWCVGIDLAWGPRARTGLAVLEPTGRLVESCTVVTDAEISEVIVRMPGDHVAAIDAPLIVPNDTGRRDCEAEVGRIFGAYSAGAHPANRSRPYFNPPRGARLADRFGWSLDPGDRPGSGRSTAIEVYPHPAMVSLFGLGTVIPYKDKPGRDLPSLKAAFAVLLDHLERVAGPVLALSDSERWAQIRTIAADAQRKSELGRLEDEVDAILCAYLAWLWATDDSRMEVLGDLRRGYIVIPGRPVAAPARRALVSTRPADAETCADGLAEAMRAEVTALSSDEAQRLARLARTWLL